MDTAQSSKYGGSSDPYGLCPNCGVPNKVDWGVAQTILGSHVGGGDQIVMSVFLTALQKMAREKNVKVKIRLHLPTPTETYRGVIVYVKDVVTGELITAGKVIFGKEPVHHRFFVYEKYGRGKKYFLTWDTKAENRVYTLLHEPSDSVLLNDYLVGEESLLTGQSPSDKQIKLLNMEKIAREMVEQAFRTK